MDIKQVLIEHWPRLQSTNFFILFTQTFDDTDTVDLNIKESEILIKFEGRTIVIDLENYFELNTHSLSLLVIKSNYISFRLNTNNENGFYMEYLKNSSAKQLHTERLELKPNLKADDSVTIVCDTCTSKLSTEMKFKRILELPSENMDLSEWFCHKHTHSAAEPDTKSEEKFNFAKFEARPADLLYGQFFFLLNAKQLQNVRFMGTAAHCKRCLKYLGDTRTETVQIWNENVRFETADSNQHLFVDSIFENFLFIIEKLIQDFDFLLFSTGLPQPLKCLFEARPSNQKNFVVQYLLVQVMNKSIEMFQQNEIEVADRITLRKIKSMKILYRSMICDVVVDDADQQQSTSTNESPLISFWQNDATVNHIQISMNMMQCAIDRLDENAELIAECYRQSGTIGFSLSYLFKK